jgi:hypothetical protein
METEIYNDTTMLELMEDDAENLGSPEFLSITKMDMRKPIEEFFTIRHKLCGKKYNLLSVKYSSDGDPICPHCGCV